jgi:hypothetical protein
MRGLLTLLFLASSLRGAVLYQFTLDTSGLMGGVDFVLNGQLVGTQGSRARFYQFDHGAGGSGPAGDYLLDTSTAFFNEFQHMFQRGGLLRFLIHIEPVFPAPGDFPDQLSLYLLDDLFNPLPTDDPAGAILIVDLDDPLTPQTFSVLNPPLGPPQIAEVPEPGTLLVALLGLAIVALTSRWNGRWRGV